MSNRHSPHSASWARLRQAGGNATMAASSRMTWSWNWKLVVTGVAALTGVLGLGAPLQQFAKPSAPPQESASHAAAQITAVSALEEEARQLDRNLDALDAAPSTRNPFRFGERPAVHRPIAPPPAAAFSLGAQAAAPAPFPLKLTGIAVDVVNGVENAPAIVSGPSGLELAAKGEVAAPGYRVIEVGESFAEIERVSDGVRERLTLRP